MNRFPEPVNKAERHIVEVVQQTANEVSERAILEVRRADAVRAVANQALDLVHEEFKIYREGTEAQMHLQDAVTALSKAEKLIRARGEVIK